MRPCAGRGSSILKKLKEEGKHPKPELLETLAEQIKTLQRDGAHPNASAFQQIGETFADVRRDGAT